MCCVSRTDVWLSCSLQSERAVANAWIRSSGGFAITSAYNTLNTTDENLQGIDYEKAKIQKPEMDTKEKFKSYLQEHRKKVLLP